MNCRLGKQKGKGAKQKPPPHSMLVRTLEHKQSFRFANRSMKKHQIALILTNQ